MTEDIDGFAMAECRVCSKREGRKVLKMACLFTPSGIKAKTCQMCQSDYNGTRYGRGKRADGASLNRLFPHREQMPARVK